MNRLELLGLLSLALTLVGGLALLLGLVVIKAHAR
jgi:hypothetical protein